MVLALVLALASSVAVAPPRASDRAEVAARERVVVGLTGSGAPFSAGRCAEVLRGHVDAEPEVVPVTGEVYAWSRAVAAERGVRAVLWLELRPPGPHRLYLFEAGADRVYVRELGDPGDAEALLESLGVVTHALLESVAAGEAPAGMRAVEPAEEPAEVPASEPTPTAVEPRPASPRERVRVEVAASYLGRSLAAGAPWQSGVGLRVGVVLRGVLVNFGAGWLAPARARGEVELELRRAPFDAQVGYRFRRARAVAIDAAIAVVFERLAWSVRGPAGAQAQGPTQALRVGVGPVAGIVWRAWRGLQVRLHARADAWARDVSLQVATPAGPRVTLAPPAVSAGLDVGLGWSF